MARIVVELDGSHHFEEKAQAYDERRTKELSNIGIEILRYTNREIEESFESVCTSIDVTIKERMT